MIENRIPPHRTGAPMAVSTLPPRGTSAAPVAAPSELVQHWIGGRIAGGAGTRALPVFNPATGAVTRQVALAGAEDVRDAVASEGDLERHGDRKSTRLNSSHEWISYAGF